MTAGAASAATIADSVGVDIEIDVFSGRPNPSWQVTGAPAVELLALLSDLPDAAPPPAADLGYRGFLVKPQGSGQAATRVFAGRVQTGTQTRADARGAEAWLWNSARANGWGALADSFAPR